MVKLIVRIPEKKRERLPLFRSRPATLAKKQENLASHSRIRITARQGKYIGGQPKLGFDIVDRRYLVNEVEAKLVRRIFKLATQQQSCLKIAETLNAEGLRSKVFTTKTGKTMGGKHYTSRLINNILTDAKYIGKIVHKGQSYDAEHPAILSQEQFEQVRNVLRSNRVYTHRHQTKRIAMLRRLVHCSHCGRGHASLDKQPRTRVPVLHMRQEGQNRV
jgi:site-specific DNA recombinase